MENNILKIDLDSKSEQKAIKLLKERFSYMHDLGFLNFSKVEDIYLIKKSTYGAKVILKEDIKPENIILLQLILGSDWRKEINTYLNHFILKMEYSNRLFDCKRYIDGSLKFSSKIPVYERIRIFVYSKRRKWKN